jgi:hypothetical protein
MIDRTLASGEAPAPSRRTPLLPVVATGLAGFAASIVWYSPLLFGDVLQALDSTPAPPAWAMLFAPLREMATAYVLARLIRRLALFDVRRAAALGAGLWLAFHAVMMSGAALFSGMNPTVAAIHAGDWLMKLTLISVLLAWWFGRGARGR